ncbi:MAG: acetylornithine/succinyldiaminopimelate transaminase [SAR324 cluster bacterium]|nr:acetylornithine/succinyldiaminopimelate transaminase [SAR324 cluster bacterium]
MTKNQDLLTRGKNVMVPNYAPLPIVPVRAQGVTLFDADDKEYIDLTGGIAVTALGHCNREVTKVIAEQAATLMHVSNYFTNEPAIELAEALCEKTGFERVFFANSGSEVNEAALKLARRYATNLGDKPKHKIIAFHKAFHGRSLFTVTAGGTDAYKAGFGPLPAKMEHTSFNDLESLSAMMDGETCAVIMEPIMGEGGIHGSATEFAQGVRDLCDQHQALLVFDEVQTGMGRTGDLFCFQGLSVKPDILTTAKALGNGFPIGAMMTTAKIAEAFQPGTHGSTFGGNPLACSVGKKVLEIISRPETLAQVKKSGKLITAKMNTINEEFPIFSEIRGKGLLIGCQLNEQFKDKTKDILNKGIEQGVLTLLAGPDVLRFAPSLLITEDEINKALGKLRLAIKEVYNESK